jgi:hypothetical protein
MYNVPEDKMDDLGMFDGSVTLTGHKVLWARDAI